VGVEGLEALELATSDDGPEGRLNEARQRIARHRAALRAQQAQQALPLDLGPAFVPPVREPGPKETREQLLERLLDPLLTLRDTAVLLGVCPTTVRRYTNRGMLAHLRTGGNQRRFRLSQVLEFMERQDQPTR
jgi:excisionase family DNA binding protein